MKFFGQHRRPFVLSSALTDCLSHISFRRYSPLSVEPNKCKSFLAPHFSWGTTPTDLQQVVSAIYHTPFGKVWLSSVCWSPSAKPGNEVESRIYTGWVKMAVQFEAVCGPKFMRRCRRPLVVVNTVA